MCYSKHARYESQPEIIEKEMEEILEEIFSSFLKRQGTILIQILRSGNFVKMKFLTLEEWEKYNWPEQYKHTDFDIDVSFGIRRTGLIIRSAH